MDSIVVLKFSDFFPMVSTSLPFWKYPVLTKKKKIILGEERGKCLLY